MTKTIQTYSGETTINERGKDMNMQKPETNEDMRLLLTLSNNLNELYENINKLNYALKGYVSQNEKLEQILSAIKSEGGNANP